MNAQEPQFMTQQDAFGNLEKVDTTKFNFKIVCKEPGCFQVRYVQSQDKSQVKYCKPHSRIYRLKSRARRARNARAGKKAAV